MRLRWKGRVGGGGGRNGGRGGGEGVERWSVEGRRYRRWGWMEYREGMVGEEGGSEGAAVKAARKLFLGLIPNPSRS